MVRSVLTFGFGATAIWDNWSQHQFRWFFLSNLLHNFLNDHYGNYSIFSNLFAMVPQFIHLLRTEHCLLCKAEILDFISMPTSEWMISKRNQEQHIHEVALGISLHCESRVTSCTKRKVRPQWHPISQYLLCTLHQHWIYQHNGQVATTLTLVLQYSVHCEPILVYLLRFSAHSALTYSTVHTVLPHWHTFTVECTQCVHLQYSAQKAPTLTHLLQYGEHSALTYSTVHTVRPN
jgi:hypothetical protein